MKSTFSFQCNVLRTKHNRHVFCVPGLQLAAAAQVFEAMLPFFLDAGAIPQPFVDRDAFLKRLSSFTQVCKHGDGGGKHSKCPRGKKSTVAFCLLFCRLPISAGRPLPGWAGRRKAVPVFDFGLPVGQRRDVKRLRYRKSRDVKTCL